MLAVHVDVAGVSRALEFVDNRPVVHAERRHPQACVSRELHLAALDSELESDESGPRGHGVSMSRLCALRNMSALTILVPQLTFFQSFTFRNIADLAAQGLPASRRGWRPKDPNGGPGWPLQRATCPCASQPLIACLRTRTSVTRLARDRDYGKGASSRGWPGTRRGSLWEGHVPGVVTSSIFGRSAARRRRRPLRRSPRRSVDLQRRH